MVAARGLTNESVRVLLLVVVGQDNQSLGTERGERSFYSIACRGRKGSISIDSCGPHSPPDPATKAAIPLLPDMRTAFWTLVLLLLSPLSSSSPRLPSTPWPRQRVRGPNNYHDASIKSFVTEVSRIAGYFVSDSNAALLSGHAGGTRSVRKRSSGLSGVVVPFGATVALLVETMLLTVLSLERDTSGNKRLPVTIVRSTDNHIT